MEDLRYPIGKFQFDAEVTPAKRAAWIGLIAATPGELRAAVEGLAESRLDSPYRPGGWTVRQLVHHVADSHINAYVRFRLALTEDAPQIKTYDQGSWAELSDARTAPVQWSLDLLDNLHQRWTALLRSMAPDDFARVMAHPEWGQITLDFMLQLYAWHGPHHVQHARRAA